MRGASYYNRKRMQAEALSATDLRRAIVRGDYAAVRRTVARHPYLVHWPFGRAADKPVHVAARAGRARIVRLLLQLGGADPNARNARLQTPMHLCVLHRRHATVRPLIDGGRADLAAADYFGNTPLDLAMMTHDKCCVDMLLNYEMPTSVANRAFYRAATQDNTILMNKLLNRGAQIEYKDELTGFTALLMATKNKRVRTTQFLLEKGADPAAHDSSGWTCLHFAVFHVYPVRTLMTMMKKGAATLIDRRTRNHETALHLAAWRGNTEAARALLRYGALVDPLDYKFQTPLLIALHCQQDTVVKCLVYGGANVNRAPGSCEAPLHVAVARQHLLLTHFLLGHGAVVVDPRKDDLDWTVIHTVCELGATDILECLLAYTKPAVLGLLHRFGRPRPPLVVAAFMGHRSTVDALLARGVDVNVPCFNGETSLHAAVRANSAPLVDRLLDVGACVDSRDTAAGRRPLDVAVYSWGHHVSVTAHLVHVDRMAKAVVLEDVDAVAFLLACGVTPNMTTETFGTPLHVAVRHRRYRLMSTILASDRCRTTVRHRGVTALEHALAARDSRAVNMILWWDRQRRPRTRHPSLTGTAEDRHQGTTTQQQQPSKPVARRRRSSV